MLVECHMLDGCMGTSLWHVQLRDTTTFNVPWSLLVCLCLYRRKRQDINNAFKLESSYLDVSSLVNWKGTAASSSWNTIHILTSCRKHSKMNTSSVLMHLHLHRLLLPLPSMITSPLACLIHLRKHVIIDNEVVASHGWSTSSLMIVLLLPKANYNDIIWYISPTRSFVPLFLSCSNGYYSEHRSSSTCP